MGFDQLSDEDIVKKLRQAKSQLEHAQESLRLSELEGSLSKWQDQLCAIETKLNEVGHPSEMPHLLYHIGCRRLRKFPGNSRSRQVYHTVSTKSVLPFLMEMILQALGIQ